MPNYKAHIGGGIVFFIIAFFVAVYYLTFTVEFALGLQWFASCVFGALFPDIDTKSKIQRFVYIGMLGFLLFLAHQQQSSLFMAVTFLAIVPLIVNHRTLFHRPIFILFIALTGATVLTMYQPHLKIIIFSNAFFFIVGCISHIFLDKGFKGVFRL